MVLQVLADGGQVHDRTDAVSGEFLLRPDPRQHEKLGRVDDAARQQHFAACRDVALGTAVPD